MSIFGDVFDWGRKEAEAHQLGDALRVGNEPDVADKLRTVLYERDASSIIMRANQVATQHASWDVHGPNGMGEDRLRINGNGTIDLVDNWTNQGKYIARLGDPGSVRL